MKIDESLDQIFQMMGTGFMANIKIALELVKSQGLQKPFDKIISLAFKDDYTKNKFPESELIEHDLDMYFNQTCLNSPIKLNPLIKYHQKMQYLWIYSIVKQRKPLKLPNWFFDRNLISLEIDSNSGIVTEELLLQIARMPILSELIIRNNIINKIPSQLAQTANKEFFFRLSGNNIENADNLFLNPNVAYLELGDNPLKSIPPAPKDTTLEFLEIDISNIILNDFKKNIVTYSMLESLSIISNNVNISVDLENYLDEYIEEVSVYEHKNNG